MAKKEINKKRKFKECHKKGISWVSVTEVACDKNKKGVKRQCSIQRLLAVAPMWSELISIIFINDPKYKSFIYFGS